MRLEDVYYLTLVDVMYVHYKVIFEEEDRGVLKHNELDSALMAVQATFNGEPLLTFLAEIAAAYIFYLNRSHVFMDGNKRTSLVTALTFLQVNGVRLRRQSNRWWLNVITGVVSHEVSQVDLVDLFIEVMGSPYNLEWRLLASASSQIKSGRNVTIRDVRSLSGRETGSTKVLVWMVWTARSFVGYASGS